MLNELEVSELKHSRIYYGNCENFFLLFLLLFSTISSFVCSKNNDCDSTDKTDLTIIGPTHETTSIGYFTADVIETLKNELTLNVIRIKRTNREALLPNVAECQEIIEKPYLGPGRVALLLDNIPWCKGGHNYEKVPSSKIKIAYSMFEMTKIPKEWSKILNKFFDLVVVPDPYWVKKYQVSGVKIPIFVVPLGIHKIDELINIKRTVDQTKPFVFGSTVTNTAIKNLRLLISAFDEEFDISEDVILKINSSLSFRGIDPNDPWFKSITKNHIFFNENLLCRSDYVSFLCDIDCYVNLSKGEGFSITPREALALQIPCILTNNTAQKTICNSGLVRAVPSKIKEPADLNFQGLYGDIDMGCCFNCSIEDVRTALRDVYENYAMYCKKAQKGPSWASQYSWKNLKYRYLNLVKPKKIILGDRNEVTDDYFMTNSKKLYRKYLKAFGQRDE